MVNDRSKKKPQMKETDRLEIISAAEERIKALTDMLQASKQVCTELRILLTRLTKIGMVGTK